MNLEVKSFKNLTTSELYAILQLRSEVFVVEQNCVYQDMDGKDQEALHIIGRKAGKIIAYTRLFDAGAYFENPSIGRVIVAKSERKYGYGHELMTYSIKAAQEHYDKQGITIAAQTYLIKFYEQHGFAISGDEFLEDGIPHIPMTRN